MLQRSDPWRTTPGGWEAVAKIHSPSFFADAASSPVLIRWRMRFPTAIGTGWREDNKVWVVLKGWNDDPRYGIVFKPNRAQDRYTSPDVYFEKYSGGSTIAAEAWTHKLTPSGVNAGWVKFLWRLRPDGTGVLACDHGDGAGFCEYLSTPIGTAPAIYGIEFRYKTGSGSRNYRVNIDDIEVMYE